MAERIPSPDAQAVLARLRVRSAELRVMTAAVDEVVDMLKSGYITPAGALYLLWENGVDDLLDDQLEDEAA